MTAPGRRAALCQQVIKKLTGIDFVQVVDPAVQTVLRVFFIIDPTTTVPVLVNAGTVPAVPPGNSQGPAVAAGVAPLTRLATAAGDVVLPIKARRWRRVISFGAPRVVLELEVDEPGGFEPYRLTLTDPARIDILAGTILFDFKQACPTGFDCEADPDCPGDPPVDVPIDYLARDFYSIRTALLDFAAARYPDWREPLEADTAVMLMEIMAALGDEFAYQQDRIDAETRFATATQRASLAALAKLVDYEIGRGVPASGDLMVMAKPPGGFLPADSTFWARPDATSYLPFSTTGTLWVHPRWNLFDVHNPDPEQDCLGHGVTTLMLKSAAAAGGETPFGIARADFLVNKRVPKKIVILSNPKDPSRPKRAIPVHITAIEEFTDTLILTGGLPTFVTQIHWDDAEATEVELPFDGLQVAMNVVPIAAGEVVTEYFRTGTEADLIQRYPGIGPELLARMAALPPAVEREGPIASDRSGRETIFRYGLRATEHQSLRHGAGGAPDGLSLEEIEPPPLPIPLPLPLDDDTLYVQFQLVTTWEYFKDLLDGDLDTQDFTLEPGLWRTVRSYELPFGSFDFQDYASNSGWTIRFGAGEFGQAPDYGAILKVRYATDPGIIANVASDSLGLTPPPGETVPAAVAALVASATNPLPFGNAKAEEDAATTRLLAPEAYRAEPRRAVRPEDYSAIIERQPFVQRASSTTHWTGSWSTDFVAVDPKASIALSPDQAVTVVREIDCVRLAARDARRVDADYLDIDIELLICVAADAYSGDVVEALTAALAAPGFFSPDNFTFGTPLIRSALEAAAQKVTGVRFVDAINIRIHGIGDWRPFAEPELRPAPGQIVRLQNDPDRAALGILRIKPHGGH
jgi:hypothetical protein